MQNKLRQFIKLALAERVSTEEDFRKLERKFAKNNQLAFLSHNIILAEYRQMIKHKEVPFDEQLIGALRKRRIRTLSGIASFGVHTKPYPCPGKCIYCPSEKGMPKSYLSSQPAVMRSLAQNFDPYKMIQVRLCAYYENGHPTDKCELIVMGGTWSYLNPIYQVWFLKRCFDSFNNGINNNIKKGEINEPKISSKLNGNKMIFKKLFKELKQAQKKNEKADCRVVGLTLETRPDFISEKEVAWMRKLGATRVEMGVQSIYDDVLKINKRGHNVKATIRATKLFKDAGFKITYHLMPGLLGSSPRKDLAMFKSIFNNSNFQPDQIKIYPTIVSKHAKLYKLWKKEIYKPYTDFILKKLLKNIKLICPTYVRIARLYREIPKQSIYGGMKTINIRQLIQEELKKEDKFCKCIRCREVREKQLRLKDIKLVKREYRASGGKEVFLSFESKDKKILFAFCRLRFPAQRNKNHYIKVLHYAALIRELHTYGELTNISTRNGKIQHKGLGKRLMEKAEVLSKKAGYKKIAVIAGIGVRGYFRKLGYQLKQEYMIKFL